MIFRLLLLFLLATPAGAEDIVPQIRLHWAPAAQTLTVDFAAGCMSSTIPVRDEALRATFRDGALVLSGRFVSDTPHGLLVTTDFGNCPERQIVLRDVAPGTYPVRFDRREVRRVTLDKEALEIVVKPKPFATMADLRDLRTYGTARVWSVKERPMRPLFLEAIGPADIIEPGGGGVVRVRPEPLIYWEPHGRAMQVTFLFGCLTGPHLYLGSSASVEVSRESRTLTVTGELRFLPLPPREGPDECIGVRPEWLPFDKVEPGLWRVLREGERLFEAEFHPRLDMNVDRTGGRFLE